MPPVIRSKRSAFKPGISPPPIRHNRLDIGQAHLFKNTNRNVIGETICIAVFIRIAPGRDVRKSNADRLTRINIRS